MNIFVHPDSVVGVRQRCDLHGRATWHNAEKVNSTAIMRPYRSGLDILSWRTELVAA